MEKVLIIDDNFLFRNMSREGLLSQRPSLMILEAKNRKEAMEIIQTSLPDLIIMEIRLPDGNGLEIIHQIKKLYPGIKVVLVTAYDLPECREAAFRYKTDHYVAKDTFMSFLSRILPETS